MRRSGFFPWRTLVFCCSASLCRESLAVSQLKLFEKAPPFSVADLDGKTVSSETIRGRPAILVFGELYNRNTIAALGDLAKLRTLQNLKASAMPIYLILAQVRTADELRKAQREHGIEAVILHDTARAAYAAFGVVVLPSVVVLDKDGLVCVAISGYPLTFSDVMEDALLYGIGKLTRPAFEKALHPTPGQTGEDEGSVRSRRIGAFAEQLLRRGYTELAVQRFEEALKLDAKNGAARVGLARCLIKLNRLDDAEKQIEDALAADPDGMETNVARAQLEILRGGDDLARARARLLRVVLAHPGDPEGHYLLGKVHELEGGLEKALAEYKSAAELLLEARGR